MAEKNNVMQANAQNLNSVSNVAGYEPPPVNPKDVIFDLGGRQVTAILDDSTYELVKNDFNLIINKAVAVTGNKTVGYGLSGAKLYGVIKAMEYNRLVTVQIDGIDDKFKGSGIVAGDSISVDGSGGVTKASAVNETLVLDVSDDGTLAVKF